MYAYAQTNVQLFNQLRSLAYSTEDLQIVHGAYDLGTRLFSGLYVQSGKPFISHLVGTASVLGSVHAPATLVAAGLLHSAYYRADFGRWARGLSPVNRAEVRGAVGEEVEQYVYRFATQRWSPQRIPLILDTLHERDELDRSVILMQLANEVEHYAEAGVLYRLNGDSWRRKIHRLGPVMVDMARALDSPTLADELTRAFQDTIEPEVSEQRPGCERYPVWIAPKSYRRRWSMALYQGLARGFRKMRSSIRGGQNAQS